MSLDQNAQLSNNRFAATRWSLVAGLKAGAGERQRCMTELCHAYAYPVYVYVRHSGHDPETAQRLLHGFFSKLLKELGRRTLSGRFRSFLLERLTSFLANPTPADELLTDLPELSGLEGRLTREQAFSGKPEVAFQRGFAVEIVARSLERLKQEAKANGRLELFESLQPYLAAEPGAEQYQHLSTELGRPTLALVVALKRLRSRFRELVDDELAETVSNPEDQGVEREVLKSLLEASVQTT